MSKEEARGSDKRSSAGPLIAVASVVLFLLAAPLYALLSPEEEDGSDNGMGAFGGTTVELTDLNPPLATMYRDVSSHSEHFEHIPCFCGCEEALDHRHLLDCFVRPGGGGWESHAMGCEVCQGEAEMALLMLESGASLDAVIEHVVDEFGMPEEMRDL